MSRKSENLMLDYMGLVRALAWKIHQKLPRHVELDDLYGYGCVGLAEAARAFDERRGIEFATFAYYRIRGAILDGLAKMSWFNAARFHRDEYRSEESSSDSSGEDPPAENSSDQASVSRADLTAEMNWFRQAAERLAVGSFSGSAGSADFDPADRAVPPDKQLAQKESAARVRQLLDELPAAAAELMRATYFEGLTLQEAGKRLGRDKSWASRLHARILQRFALTLRSEGLE